MTNPSVTGAKGGWVRGWDGGGVRGRGWMGVGWGEGVGWVR